MQLVEVSSIAPIPKPAPPPRPPTPDIEVTGSRPGAPIRLGNNCRQPASYTLIHGKRIRVTEEVRKLCKPSDGLLIFRYLVGRRPHMNEIDRLMPIPAWRLSKKYDVEVGFYFFSTGLKIDVGDKIVDERILNVLTGFDYFVTNLKIPNIMFLSIRLKLVLVLRIFFERIQNWLRLLSAMQRENDES